MREKDFDLSRTALIVVDMQNDFCDNKGQIASKGRPIGSFRKIIPNVKELIEIFRKLKRPLIYLTQIYESDGTDSPFNRHDILPTFAQVKKGSIMTVRGSWGAKVIDELKPRPNENIVEKRRFSGFYNTDLETILRCNGIKTIIATGIVTYVCVESTVRDAFIRDFDVIVISDAVAGWDKEMHINSLKSMAWSCAKIITTEELLVKLNF